jgi:hypothetical protein
MTTAAAAAAAAAAATAAAAESWPPPRPHLRLLPALADVYRAADALLAARWRVADTVAQGKGEGYFLPRLAS